MFRVLKKLNNNLVLTADESDKEVLLRGKGLGFRKTPYTLKDQSAIERIYTSMHDSRIQGFVNSLPKGLLDITEEIVDEGQRMLGKQLNRSLMLSLADHLSCAIERAQNGDEFDDGIQFDIRRLYPDEMAVGEMALRTISARTGIEIPMSEASAIALHFINASYGVYDMRNTYKLTQTLSDLLMLVNKYYDLTPIKDSVQYGRFIAHLRYFIARKYGGIELSGEASGIDLSSIAQDDEMLTCIGDIETYVSEEHSWTCSADEKLYLLVHLNVLVKSMAKGEAHEGLQGNRRECP